jgi:hypothetical protein
MKLNNNKIILLILFYRIIIMNKINLLIINNLQINIVIKIIIIKINITNNQMIIKNNFKIIFKFLLKIDLKPINYNLNNKT